MFFRKKKPTDIQQVYTASDWLGISEFQIFCEAWRAWYNEYPLEKRIEPYFIDFLGQEAVPFWVRNYVRMTLGRKDLAEREKKKMTIETLTFYVPLLLFFILIMWAFFRSN